MNLAPLHAGDGRRSGPITAACDNVLAWRIGEAHAAASDVTAGDYIDRGLVLLLELRKRGLLVIQATDGAAAAPVGINGLTEAETSATASVAGIVGEYRERCEHGVRWENRCGSCDR